jgi:hypothetical protein
MEAKSFVTPGPPTIDLRGAFIKLNDSYIPNGLNRPGFHRDSVVCEVTRSPVSI